MILLYVALYSACVSSITVFVHSNSSSRFVDQSRGDASDGAADQSQLSRDSRAPNDSSVVSGGNDDTRDSVFSGDVVHVHVR
jgi:hypothetical protein